MTLLRNAMTKARRLGRLAAFALVAAGAFGTTWVHAPRAVADSPGPQIAFTANLDPRASGELYATVSGGPLVDISKSPFVDSGLAVAPHGGLIAFWSNRHGAQQVYLAGADGANVRRVTGTVESSGQTTGASLVWSPDGTALLVPRITNVTPTSVRVQALLVDVAHATARLWSADCVFPVAWSPDGHRVACSSMHPRHVTVFDESGRQRFVVPGSRPLWSASDLLTASGSRTVVDESGRRVARLRGEPLAWAPTGSLLAYQAGTRIEVADPTSREPERTVATEPERWTPAEIRGSVSFTPDGESLRYETPTGLMVASLSTGRKERLPFNGVWSSDGRHYAFSRGPRRYITGATASILIGDRLGRHARVVAHLPVDGYGNQTLAWEPQSERLLVEWSYADIGTDLWLAPLAGGTPIAITTSARSDAGAVWSPDGTRLAYSSSPLGGRLCGGCPSTVWVVALDGSPPLQLTHPRGTRGQGSFDTPVGWSPDGTKIAYTHIGFDTFAPPPEIDIVESKAGATSSTIAHGMTSRWSPDGSLIAFTDQAGVEAVAPTGGPPRLLVARTSDVYALAWSPNGASLAYSTDHGIDAVDISSGAIRHLAALPTGETTSGSPIPVSEYLGWSPDGVTIAFTGTRGLYSAPADQSAAATLIVETTSAVDPAFSPDGRWIALASNSTVEIAHPDGSDLHSLASPAYWSRDPAWRPFATPARPGTP